MTGGRKRPSKTNGEEIEDDRRSSFQAGKRRGRGIYIMGSGGEEALLRQTRDRDRL